MAAAGEVDWSSLLAGLQRMEGRSTQENLPELEETLRALVHGSLDITNRQSITPDHVSSLRQLLVSLSGAWQTTPPPPEEVGGALLQLLKLLRNLCAGVPTNQQLLLGSGVVPLVVERIVPSLNTPSPLPLHTTLVKTALQLLGNVCVGCEEGGGRVWELCFPEVFRSLLSCGSVEVADISCMVVHTCCCGQQERKNQLCSSVAGGDIMTGILSYLATADQSEWTFILLESLLTTVALQGVFEALGAHTNARATLLEFIVARLDAEETDQSDSKGHGLKSNILTEENLLFLAGTFQKHTQFLLSDENAAALNGVFAAKTTDLQQPAVVLVKTVSSLLRLLCRFTEFHHFLIALQSDSSVLDTVIALLRRVAMLDGSNVSGKHRSRLHSATPPTTEHQHPLFGLKRDLVQLLANLCYHCPHLQNKVREVGAIPLVLNQCSIDHYNPYITQWAVLAIRNLCEENPANQELIAGLERRGVADTQALLEFGCEVEIGDDGKMKLKTKKH